MFEISLNLHQSFQSKLHICFVFLKTLLVIKNLDIFSFQTNFKLFNTCKDLQITSEVYPVNYTNQQFEKQLLQGIHLEYCPVSKVLKDAHMQPKHTLIQANKFFNI